MDWTFLFFFPALLAGVGIYSLAEAVERIADIMEKK